VVQEDASSSQRDNLKVSRIGEKKKSKRRITLSDGSSFSVLQAVIEKENIYKEKTLSPDEIDSLVSESNTIEAEQYALTLLAGALHSIYLLTMKLKKKGFPDPVIERVVHHLEELDYLNDREFARAWVTSRLKRYPESRRALFSGLRKKGISTHTAESVLSELVTEESESECVRELMHRLSVTGRTEEKIVNTLLSRGFTMKVVRECLKEQK
jgi:regulatory protein